MYDIASLNISLQSFQSLYWTLAKEERLSKINEETKSWRNLALSIWDWWLKQRMHHRFCLHRRLTKLQQNFISEHRRIQLYEWDRFTNITLVIVTVSWRFLTIRFCTKIVSTTVISYLVCSLNLSYKSTTLHQKRPCFYNRVATGTTQVKDIQTNMLKNTL